MGEGLGRPEGDDLTLVCVEMWMYMQMDDVEEVTVHM